MSDEKHVVEEVGEYFATQAFETFELQNQSMTDNDIVVFYSGMNILANNLAEAVGMEEAASLILEVSQKWIQNGGAFSQTMVTANVTKNRSLDELPSLDILAEEFNNAVDKLHPSEDDQVATGKEGDAGKILFNKFLKKLSQQCGKAKVCFIREYEVERVNYKVSWGTGFAEAAAVAAAGAAVAGAEDAAAAAVAVAEDAAVAAAEDAAAVAAAVAVAEDAAAAAVAGAEDAAAVAGAEDGADTKYVMDIGGEGSVKILDAKTGRERKDWIKAVGQEWKEEFNKLRRKKDWQQTVDKLFEKVNNSVELNNIVMVGMTGNWRTSGAAENIDVVKGILKKKLPNLVKCEVLNAEDEAKYEHKSAKNAVRLLLSGVEPNAKIATFGSGSSSTQFGLSQLDEGGTHIYKSYNKGTGGYGEVENAMEMDLNRVVEVLVTLSKSLGYLLAMDKRSISRQKLKTHERDVAAEVLKSSTLYGISDKGPREAKTLVQEALAKTTLSDELLETLGMLAGGTKRRGAKRRGAKRKGTKRKCKGSKKRKGTKRKGTKRKGAKRRGTNRKKRKGTKRKKRKGTRRR